MAYEAIVIDLQQLKPHSNADRLQVASVCGASVIVSLDAQEGDVGVFFDVDGQLSPQFTAAAQLYNKASHNLDPNGPTGFFDTNRKVRAMSLRGERSEGFWMPIASFVKAYNLCSKDPITVTSLNIGDTFSKLGDVEICNKFVAKATKDRTRSVKKPKARTPYFHEHVSTPQLGRNLESITNGRAYVSTLKLHGTSGRTSYTKVYRQYKPTLWDKFKSFFGFRYPEYQDPVWEYVNGSRRVTILSEKDNSGAFHDPSLREQAGNLFKDKLTKGETVYYEIVGYEPDGKPIMPASTTDKLKKFVSKQDFKDIKRVVGDVADYSYRCLPKQHAVFIYRITGTDEEGVQYDYTHQQVKDRCEQLDVPMVPTVREGVWDDDSYTIMKADATHMMEGHITEGVVVRFTDTPDFEVYKEKSFLFKVLEGIVKDDEAYVDTEESEDV